MTFLQIPKWNFIFIAKIENCIGYFCKPQIAQNKILIYVNLFIYMIFRQKIN